MNNTLSSLYALHIGFQVLEEIKKDIGEEEYNKIVNSPVRSCKCGFIKEGDYTICPKCEVKKWQVLYIKIKIGCKMQQKFKNLILN